MLDVDEGHYEFREFNELIRYMISGTKKEDSEVIGDYADFPGDDEGLTKKQRERKLYCDFDTLITVYNSDNNNSDSE